MWGYVIIVHVDLLGWHVENRYEYNLPPISLSKSVIFHTRHYSFGVVSNFEGSNSGYEANFPLAFTAGGETLENNFLGAI